MDALEERLVACREKGIDNESVAAKASGASRQAGKHTAGQ